ncbi:MAG: hypothetical protein H6517_08330 [Microthrixaceae bacterium]|nr:hypothetical protein [Microthrixaceae bacterium]
MSVDTRGTRPRARRWSAVMVISLALFGVACTPPTGPGGAPSGTINIEGSRPAVNTTQVTLRLAWSTGATQMRLADGTDPTIGDWQPVAPSLPWTVPPGDGTKVVSVQFGDTAGRLSPVVSVQVVLDTIPPVLAVTTQVPEQTVDLRQGDPLGLGGVVDDPGGSGVDVVTTTDGTSAIDAVVEEGTWGVPLGADASGRVEFVTTASDVAGNLTTLSTPLNLLVPDPLATVIRPTVIDVSSLAPLVISATETELVLSGDQSAWFDGRSTLVMGESEALPFGLLGTIDEVAFESASDTTTLELSEASMFDVYAQYQPPPAAATRSGDPAAACESFASSGSGGTVVDLPALGADLPLPFPGPSTSTVGASIDPEIALNLTADLSWRMGFPPSLRDGSELSVGALVCSDWDLTAEKTADSLLGPRFTTGVGEGAYQAEFGVKNLDLGTTGFGFLKVNSDGESASTFCRRLLPSPFGVPLGPLPLKLNATAAVKLCATDISWAAGASLAAHTDMGATVGIRKDGDGYSPIVDPTVDGEVTGLELYADGALKWKPNLAFGLKLNANPGPDSSWTKWLDRVNATGEFAEVGLKLGPEANVTWADDLIRDGGTRLATTVDLCADAYAELGASLTVNIDLGTILGRKIQKRWTLFDVTLAGIEQELGCENLYDSATADESITTATLVDAALNTPYSARLSATSPATWTVVSGALPPGLALSSTGVVSGAPSALGTSVFRVRATFPGGGIAEADLSLVVGAPARWTYMRFGTNSPDSQMFHSSVPGYWPDEIDSAVRVRVADWEAETSAFLFGRTGNVNSANNDWHTRLSGDWWLFNFKVLKDDPTSQWDVQSVYRYIPRDSVPFNDGEWIWLRVRYDRTSGAQFFYSTAQGDGYPTDWVGLGSGAASPSPTATPQPYLGKAMAYSAEPADPAAGNADMRVGNALTNGVGLGGDIRTWFISDPSGGFPPYHLDLDLIDNMGAVSWTDSRQGASSHEINGWTWTRGSSISGWSTQFFFYGQSP